MSVMSQALNNWLQRHNTSVMKQEVSVCDRFPEHTRASMIDMAIRSAMVDREKGAPITQDYTLGKEQTGLKDRVPVPRPAGTIGIYHTHPYGWPRPSTHDVLDILDKGDKISCIGAHGKPGTKIQCFAPKEPKWSEIKVKFDRLNNDILEHNKKVWNKYEKRGRDLLRVIMSERTPEDYNEYLVLINRKNTLTEEITAQVRELAAPEEWKAQKWVNGFAEVPFFEAHPNMFSKCRILWEELEEELPYEL